MRIENGYLVGVAIQWSKDTEEVDRLELMRPMDVSVSKYYSDGENAGYPVYDEVAIPMALSPVVYAGYKNHVKLVFDGDGVFMVGTIDTFLKAVDEYNTAGFEFVTDMTGE